MKLIELILILTLNGADEGIAQETSIFQITHNKTTTIIN